MISRCDSIVPRLKIGVWHNLPSGGGKRALYHHVRGLVERGYSVEIWSPETADRTYLPLDQLAPEHVLPLAWKAFPERGFIGRAAGLGVGFARNAQAMADHSARCAEQMTAWGADVLFANSCRFFGAPMIGRAWPKKKVLYLQEPTRGLYEARPEWPWNALPLEVRRSWKPRNIKSRLVDALRIRVLRAQAREEFQNAHAFDAVLVNSSFSRESLLRVYGLNARVCYLGIETSLFRDLSLPREKLVLSTGSLAPSKGVELLIRAIALLPEPRPRLVWVANSHDPAYLATMSELAASTHVPWEVRTGIPDAELIELLNRASVFIYAPRLEPFGFAPLEANACGTPVVAAAEGGVRETIQDGVNGLLAEAIPSAMARAVGQLLNDPPAARAMGQRGRDLVASQWPVEQSVDRLEQHLLELLRN